MKKILSLMALLLSAAHSAAQPDGMVLPACSVNTTCPTFYVPSVTFPNGSSMSTAGGGPPSGPVGGVDVGGTFPNGLTVPGLAAKASTGTDNSMSRANALTTLGASTVSALGNLSVAGSVTAGNNSIVLYSTGAISAVKYFGDVSEAYGAPISTITVARLVVVAADTTTLRVDLTAETTTRLAADLSIGVATAAHQSQLNQVATDTTTLFSVKASTGINSSITRLNSVTIIASSPTVVGSATVQGNVLAKNYYTPGAAIPMHSVVMSTHQMETASITQVFGSSACVPGSTTPFNQPFTGPANLSFQAVVTNSVVSNLISFNFLLDGQFIVDYGYGYANAYTDSLGTPVQIAMELGVPTVTAGAHNVCIVIAASSGASTVYGPLVDLQVNQIKVISY